MKLHRLVLTNYRGITHREVDFPDRGVVVISGANEIGKSSMIEALDLLLEVKDRSTKREVKDVKPTHADVGAEAKKLFPLMEEKHFVGAMYDPIEGHVDPYGVTHAYAKSAQVGGADRDLSDQGEHGGVLNASSSGDGPWRGGRAAWRARRWA